MRASYRDGKPLVWNRVNDLPDYAYFDHSIHVNKGVACRTCHGDVGEMPLTGERRRCTWSGASNAIAIRGDLLGRGS